MFDFPLSSRAKRSGNGWVDICPAHDDNSPSLSVAYKNGKLLLKCFAGCSFQEIVSCVNNNTRYSRAIPLYETRAIKYNYDDGILYNIIDGLRPIEKDTPVGKYLRSRGLDNYQDLKDIKYHPDLHYSRCKAYPAMVGIIKDGIKVIGVHRTFITHEGEKLEKKIWGKVSGGCIKLIDNNRSNIYVSEGIENALSYIKLYPNNLSNISLYVACNANNISNINLPKRIGKESNLTVIADNDEAGLTNSDKLLRRASKLGWRTFEFAPNSGDWNDELMKRIYTNG